MFLQVQFNVPEGFSRLALEHKCRPGSKLKAVCTTRLQAQLARPFAAFQLACSNAWSLLRFWGPTLPLLSPQQGVHLY